MEYYSGGLTKFLENKTILITGSTGFLAKVFVEKVLRVQPHVKKLFLLLRAEDTASATRRLRNVMGKEVFRVLREEHGNGFDEFILDKVTPVAGDISLNNLGIQDTPLQEKMWKEINFIVNVAGTTAFDERYEVALGTNAMGAKHVCEFAKKCANLELLVHVSTAYVTKENEGLILEKPLLFNGLDIAVELNTAEKRLKELHDKEATDEALRFSMKELGMQRARLHGWSNTYVFSKAMGEMLIGDLREDLPLVIVRPTIITSTFMEPFPGWTEGLRTIDSVFCGYGMGKMKHFLADPESIMDVIPGDMVVNAMMVSMATYRLQPLEVIYHVGSSMQNPVRFHELAIWAYEYLSKNPLLEKNGKPILVSSLYLYPTVDSFYKYMNLHYKLPLQVLGILNELSFKSFGDLYSNLNRKCNLLMRFVQLYQPFLFFKGIFDNANMEKLRVAMKDDEHQKVFQFDPKQIEWEDYFKNVHFPGVAKFVLK